MSDKHRHMNCISVMHPCGNRPVKARTVLPGKVNVPVVSVSMSKRAFPKRRYYFVVEIYEVDKTGKRFL